MSQLVTSVMMMSSHLRKSVVSQVTSRSVHGLRYNDVIACDVNHDDVILLSEKVLGQSGDYKVNQSTDVPVTWSKMQ